MSTRPQKPRRNLTTVIPLIAVIIGMIGLSFASVPLYRLFCQVTGYGGTTQRAEAASEKVSADTVTVRFDAAVSPDLAWEFRPLTSFVQVHPGEQKEVFFRAVNRSTQPLTGAATYNVTPTKAGIYFDKVQCFCFSEQRLEPGESKDMGVSFFVDPDIGKDPNTGDVRTITLSYTMFRAREPETAQPAGERPNAAAGRRATLDGKSTGAIN